MIDEHDCPHTPLKELVYEDMGSYPRTVGCPDCLTTRAIRWVPAFEFPKPETHNLGTCPVVVADHGTAEQAGKWAEEEARKRLEPEEKACNCLKVKDGEPLMTNPVHFCGKDTEKPSEWIYARMKALGKPATTDTVSTEMRAILDWLDSRFS